MKKMIQLPAFILLAACIQISFISCSNADKDAGIKSAIEKRLKEDSTLSKIMVDVKDSVVTLTGECLNQSVKENVTRIAETVPFVKSVVNNCSVTNMMTDEEMNHEIWKITENITTIKIAADSGIIHLAGNLRKGEWDTLKMSLDKLHAKGYDTENLRLE